MKASQGVLFWLRAKTDVKLGENDSFDIIFISESFKMSSQIQLTGNTARRSRPGEQSFLATSLRILWNIKVVYFVKGLIGPWIIALSINSRTDRNRAKWGLFLVWLYFLGTCFFPFLNEPAALDEMNE